MPAVDKPKRYRVILEDVSVPKKAKCSIASYEDTAPPGYTHVPLGIKPLTDYCWDECRRRGLGVYEVKSVPTYGNRNDENKVYNHVNRLGHHFPNDVVDKGYDALHLAPEKTRYAQDARGRWRDTDDAVISRERLFNQIRNCLYEIYPHIPEWNANQILDRAMGSDKSVVMNALDKPLGTRVQLAVTAHIRHTYTPYDELLDHKKMSWTEARALIEPFCIKKLKEWAGRDEVPADDDEMEETFKEVIVVDDDDFEDDEDTMLEERHIQTTAELIPAAALSPVEADRSSIRVRHSRIEHSQIVLDPEEYMQAFVHGRPDKSNRHVVDLTADQPRRTIMDGHEYELYPTKRAVPSMTGATPTVNPPRAAGTGFTGWNGQRFFEVPQVAPVTQAPPPLQRFFEVPKVAPISQLAAASQLAPASKLAPASQLAPVSHAPPPLQPLQLAQLHELIEELGVGRWGPGAPPPFTQAEFQKLCGPSPRQPPLAQTQLLGQGNEQQLPIPPPPVFETGKGKGPKLPPPPPARFGAGNGQGPPVPSTPNPLPGAGKGYGPGLPFAPPPPLAIDNGQGPPLPFPPPPGFLPFPPPPGFGFGLPFPMQGGPGPVGRGMPFPPPAAGLPFPLPFPPPPQGAAGNPPNMQPVPSPSFGPGGGQQVPVPTASAPGQFREVGGGPDGAQQPAKFFDITPTVQHQAQGYAQPATQTDHRDDDNGGDTRRKRKRAEELTSDEAWREILPTAETVGSKEKRRRRST